MPFHPSLKTLSDSPHDLPSDRPGKLVELLEGYGRPLMLTVPGMASVLDLLRRIVLICLKNTKGRCLHRHPPQAPLHPGLWGGTAINTVFAEESPTDAATRELFRRFSFADPD